MPTPLDDLSNAIARDQGFRADITEAQMSRAITAMRKINDLILNTIAETGANTDGLLTPREMRRLSETIQGDGDAFVHLIKIHGFDNANGDTGFHILRGNGGTSTFQGRNFVDQVADVIYHFGYRIRQSNGQYVNEDGNANGSYVQSAGWLNYFLNGRNVVWGSDRADELGSSSYDARFASARSETFFAGDGDDKVWADRGHDRVYGGAGDDVSGGGTGNDRMYGEDGRDTLYGDVGKDWLYGGNGNDLLGGGDQGDRLFGGWGQDTIHGEDGYDRLEGGLNDDELMGGNAADRLFGDAGNDKVYGDNGNDAVSGGEGNDTVGGGAGRDTLTGGDGADTFELWEMAAARDVVRIGKGDSGKAQGDRDLVEGFQNGTDVVDLRSLGRMQYRADEFRGDGNASFLYLDKGEFSELRIDTDGDRAADMIVEFRSAGDLTRGDFLFTG